MIEAIFTKIPPTVLIIGSTAIAIFMGTMALIVRSRAAKRPVSPLKIILPPLFMSTGALMFIFKEFRVPLPQIIEASLVGLVFSIVLIKTTNFENREGDIYIKRSKAFLFILLGLLIIRLLAKVILSHSIDIGELGGMFWIIAFAMIVPWRITMLVKFNRLKRESVPNE
jgi:membrane protein CcdC involved in cytochrome C biogenesis